MHCYSLHCNWRFLLCLYLRLALSSPFYCRTALLLTPGRTGGLFPRINAPIKKSTSAERQKWIFLELIGRLELPTSSLPRMRTTACAISATLATRNGLEPSTSSVTGWHSNQLNYQAALKKMVGVAGLEPTTPCL